MLLCVGSVPLLGGTWTGPNCFRESCKKVDRSGCDVYRGNGFSLLLLSQERACVVEHKLVKCYFFFFNTREWKHLA